MKDKDIIKKIKDWFDMYPPEYAGLEEWDDIGVCNKKPREGLFRQECVVPCPIGKHRRPPPPPPPPPPRYLKG